MQKGESMPDDRFDLRAAPCHIGSVMLRVRDLPEMERFYRDMLGLTTLSNSPGHLRLGRGEQVLLELVSDTGLARNDRREAGLFHTAFLLPSRVDLAHWLVHAAEQRVALQGASDHIVSEAIYLADPEGNGIEIYVDRPPSAWRDTSGKIRMSTDPLDMDGLLGEIHGGKWQGLPAGSLIGHVHLQVGDTAEAERFYGQILGFDIMLRYPGATFMAMGGYHHQIAANVWNSRGAGKRSEGMAGLGRVELVTGDAELVAAVAERARTAGIEAEATDGSVELSDPWGTRIRFAHQITDN